MIFVLAGWLIGMIASLRALTAPAVVSRVAQLGDLHLEPMPLAFLGRRALPWILSLTAQGEWGVTALWSSTPSRKVPVQFGTRIVVGGFYGAANGLAVAVAGALGAALGTLGGAPARGSLAAGFGSDRPAPWLEGAVAIGGAIPAMAVLP